MARKSFQSSRKLGRSSRGTNQRSPRAGQERRGFPVGRWLIILALIYGGYSWFKPASGDASSDTQIANQAAEGQSQPQLAKLQAKLPQGGQVASQGANSASLTQTGQAQKSTQVDSSQLSSPGVNPSAQALSLSHIWRHKRIHLAKGFIREEYLFPNEPAIWQSILTFQDTNQFVQDTLMMMVGEAWIHASTKSTQTVKIQVLKNSQGSVRYWNWKSGQLSKEWFKVDSLWVGADGCPRMELCRHSLLQQPRVRPGKGLFKTEVWKSDSSLNIYSPFDGTIQEHTGSPKQGRTLILKSNRNEFIEMSGFGNIRPGLKVGSKVHSGMQLGTLLHQKKSLKTKYTHQGFLQYLWPTTYTQKSHSSAEFNQRVKTIREVMSKG